MDATKEQLKAKRDSLIIKLKEKLSSLSHDDRTVELESEINKMITAIDKIDFELSKMENRIICSNNTISLCEKEQEQTIFYIYLNYCGRRIGHILLQPNSSYCNIGCTILEEYRGHGYFFQALCLIVDYIYSKGIKNIELFAENDNIASLKTIEKFNNLVSATKIEKNESETIYHFELSEKSMPLQNKSIPQRK